MQMSKDDSFFILLGNGAFENEIRTTATKYNLKNFKWIPFLEKPEELYAILSGLVITSQVEKTPIEMFEALACGLPVFSADAREAKRVLGKYGSGVVVSHDPQHKDFADCFKFWKSNLEIYKTAAVETAELIQRNFGV
jgi:glycosyltransferase involved in cell wall biosynthesis